jgi:uncharacterized protein YecE (DUF72 family)
VTAGLDRDRLAAAVAALARENVYVGTSSWKYPGWMGSIYEEQRYLWRGKVAQSRFEEHCLEEYASIFKSVGVDAGYYRFPDPRQLRRLAGQVPPDFRFSFKVTEDITIRRFPQMERHGSRAGQDNPDFLNADLFIDGFLGPCSEIKDQVGVLMFEFSRFHPGDFQRGAEFVERIDAFFAALPKDGWQYGVEIRNPNLLHPAYFATLHKHGVTHVFNQWERMPSVGQQLALPGSTTTDFFAARFLLKQGRSYRAAVSSFEPYERTAEVNPEAREAGAELIRDAPRTRRSYLYVNNRLEGHAPATLAAMLTLAGWMT